MLITRIDIQHSGTGAVIALVTAQGRKIVTYGTLGEGIDRAISSTTVFPLESVTKVFTAILLADMVRRHEVALDDPVSRYLKGGTKIVPTRDGREITLADLATHTSGLPLRPTNLISGDPENKYDGYTAELLYDFLSTYQLPQSPGIHYDYSNVGYGLLGVALSQAAGRSYANLVRELIAKPLRLNDTRLDRTADMQRRSAVGYTIDGRPVRDKERGALDAAGALNSTADDLATLLELALNYRKSPALAEDIAMTLETRRPGGQMPSTQTALGWNLLKVR
jgi:D-alanyl-D-alanine-carboxypeptidase/D-alanyl-D-alanine-endopeptidase